MGRVNPYSYIRSSSDKVVEPVECGFCEEEIEVVPGGELVFLTDEGLPCCSSHQDKADRVASLTHCCGSPWNGINPKTGETQFFESSSWYDVVDSKDLPSGEECISKASVEESVS